MSEAALPVPGADPTPSTVGSQPTAGSRWRLVGTLVAGVAASAWLANAAWLPADPLRSTLVLLPALLAGLRWFSHLVPRARARTLGAQAEVAALLALVVLALLRPRLGLGLGPQVLAAGFACLLLLAGARRVLALRPLLGQRVADRPPFAFALLAFLVYVAILPWSTEQRPPDGDEPFYLLVAHSLAHDLDTELTNNYAEGDWKPFLDRPLEPQPGDPRGRHGEIYSRHNALLPAVLVPAYVVGGKLGALAAMAAIGAALAWLTVLLAHHYVPDHPGEVLLAYGLLTLASPLLLFSVQVWVEVPAAVLAMIALDQALRLRNDRAWSRRRWLALAAPIVLLPFLKIRLLLLALPLLVLAWWHAGRPRRPLLLMAGALAAVGCGILVYNQVVYGNPLKIHSLDELQLDRYPVVEYALGLSGLLWDGAFGLFAAFPLWLLLLPALVLLARTRHFLLRDLLILVAPYLFIVAPRSEWYGGWSPPFRYAIVALPLLALALVPLLAERPGRRAAGARALIASLGLLSLVLTVVWLAMPGWTYNFADGRTYLLDHLAQRFDADLARFFPSSVRPRAATWWWPLASLAVVSWLWWRPRARRRQAALWGVGALFATAAALPWLAQSAPTAIVELEDPWVEHRGGHLHPGQWVVDRTRYRGGWVLRPGEWASARIVTGGALVGIEVDAMYVRNTPDPVELVLLRGDEELASWRATSDRVWQTLRFGPFAWPSGEPLVLAVRRPQPADGLDGVIVDRVRLAWRGPLR
jgi:hypothetical protein